MDEGSRHHEAQRDRDDGEKNCGKGNSRFFFFELQLDTAVRSFAAEHGIELKSDGGRIGTEDVVFLLSGGDLSKHKEVVEYTRGEALHWMLLMAKTNKRKEK